MRTSQDSIVDSKSSKNDRSSSSASNNENVIVSKSTDDSSEEEMLPRQFEANLKKSDSTSTLLILPENIEKKKKKYDERKITKEHLLQIDWWKDHLKRMKGTIIYLIVVTILLAILGNTVNGWSKFDWRGWYSISIVLIIFLLLVRNDWDPAITVMFSVTLLYTARIVTVQQALAGFCNGSVFAIAIFFVIARGVSDSGILNYLIRYLFPKTSRLLLAYVCMFVPVTCLSGFIANTPLVAMMIPIVENFARSRGFPASKFLIPLSYAAILGGTLTMIGTSTNLIVQGISQQRDPTLVFPFFLVGMIGAPIMVVGLAYVFLVGQFDRMLPVRTSVATEIVQHPRNYFVSMKVLEGSLADGNTIEEARLRHLHGVFLVEVERNGDTHAAPGSDFVLHAGDLLLFSGDVNDIGDLLSVPGLVPSKDEDTVLANYSRILAEVVLSASSQLIGKTLSEANFRDNYDAACIALYRSGEEVKGKIGNIPLKAADSLLLICKPSFLKYQAASSDFILTSQIGSSLISFPLLQMVLAPMIQIGMIIISSFEFTDLLTPALCAMYAMIFTRCLNWRSIRESVNIPVMIVIASSFPMSTALEVTGVAKELAANLLYITSWMGKFGIYIGIYLATIVLTALLSNASAAALMIPIAFQVAQTAGAVDNGVRPLLYAIMVAASADFSTPIGYQTNLMVWARGGYKFLDYTRFGLPLQILLMFISCTVIYFGSETLGSRSLVKIANSTITNSTANSTLF